MVKVDTGPWAGFDLISAYTRDQAIEDGVLVDVSETAREAGFVWLVAVTASVWHDIENIPPSKHWQDVDGRLWDVLCMARLRIKLARDKQGPYVYRLIMHVGRKTYQLYKIVMSFEGPDGGPCLTIMQLDED